MTEAVHKTHLTLVPMPDKAGRSQSCQACHPTHWQQEAMNDPSNPYLITDADGSPRFSEGDVRVSGGGCYLRRDAHTNPAAEPPFFLNALGRWYLDEVSRKDENGTSIKEMRGLYCTNCHNALSQALYVADDLTDAATQQGTTLRNKPINELVSAVAGGDENAFRTRFADPVVGAENDPLVTYYTEHTGATLVRASTDAATGALKLAAWNAAEGDPVPYDGATAGKDWWLSASEPHCADCHIAPFVESAGGDYFPIDQPNKYSLYRYSKAHGTIACQSCHQSIHGLYPVRFEGPEQTVDLTTHEQALQFSPDGKYAGPVTCAACHRVNAKGVPVQLQGTGYENDYWASVVLQHYMREGDQELPVSELVGKFAYEKSRAIVEGDVR
jgi:mono/diheme cytochrome c family protein